MHSQYIVVKHLSIIVTKRKCIENDSNIEEFSRENDCLILEEIRVEETKGNLSLKLFSFHT